MLHGIGSVWRFLVVVVVPAAASELPAGAFGDRSGLRAAVSAWVADAGSAEATHGSIAGWDTSRVDDMSYLFVDESTFNAAIGGWDTSQVARAAAARPPRPRPTTGARGGRPRRSRVLTVWRLSWL